VTVASVAGIMSRQRVAFGEAGEDLACRELQRRGYAILARRWRQRGGEIDVIARDGATVVFIEVKARGGRWFGAAAEAVTMTKQRRLVRLGQQYLARSGRTGCPCRFDVVSIHVEDGRPRVDIFQNAFDAGG
jgi:putative endonuclease